MQKPQKMIAGTGISISITIILFNRLGLGWRSKEEQLHHWIQHDERFVDVLLHSRSNSVSPIRTWDRYWGGIFNLLRQNLSLASKITKFKQTAPTHFRFQPTPIHILTEHSYRIR